jgi:hypothetical protein
MINISANAMPINKKRPVTALVRRAGMCVPRGYFPIIVEGGVQVGDWGKEAESADRWGDADLP